MQATTFFGVLTMAIVSSLESGCSTRQAHQLRFITPANRHIVAGDNVPVWVAAPPSAQETNVLFETSQDGRNYLPLPPRLAPDLGLGSHMTALDSTQFPTGPIYLRARFLDQRTGPIVKVMIRRLPEPMCTVSRSRTGEGALVFDCSGSRDQTSRIASYQWEFGDGTSVRTSIPTVTHGYKRAGRFPFLVTLTNDLGLSATLLKTLLLSNGDPKLQAPQDCGCSKMEIKTNEQSEALLPDPRRPKAGGGGGFDPVPLGPDPTYVSFNFQISAALVEGSDPALCTEGQTVKATNKLGAGPPQHKKACSAGRDLAKCKVNSDCDTRTCHGGDLDGRACDDAASAKDCTDARGQCLPNNNGVCTEYPLGGAQRGNDDYRKDMPGDIGLKRHCPGCGTPHWADFVGLAAARKAQVATDYRLDADFFSFVRGNTGSCSCHFKLVLDWDGPNQVFRNATGLTLVQDAETARCLLNP